MSTGPGPTYKEFSEGAYQEALDENERLKGEVARLNRSPKWSCFHCGETFDNETCAREHFGNDEMRDPGCVEKLKGGDLGLLRRVRELEEQLIPYLTETSAVESYVHGLNAEHAAALRREEERGYNKGVADMRSELAAAEARADALARRLAEAESLIEALCIYGDIHTVENVSYPGLYGTHAETLDRARAFLLDLASPDKGRDR